MRLRGRTVKAVPIFALKKLTLPDSVGLVNRQFLMLGCYSVERVKHRALRKNKGEVPNPDLREHQKRVPEGSDSYFEI